MKRIVCTKNCWPLLSSRTRILSTIFPSEPGPAATMVGNIVMGTRIGGAAGREIADKEEDSDMARKVTYTNGTSILDE